ncbi:hypothetical protein MATL_G00095650 [Megalops atlanticus]|uniref:Fanconi-associated nuclease n=1 Tax=Megalops atlanticus TaxID=7932 RepID=A0A9D3TA29_MEGAT|nr:hypothetical protein MATL_G00095650 [Megalops atlanticus]
MAEKRSSPGNGKKPRRSLSVTKRRGDSRANAGANSGSIALFFNNAPPANLACPLCGQMVSRFRINEHIDSQCKKFLGDHHRDGRKEENLSASSPPHNSRSIPISPRRSSPEEKKPITTSPYFKKQGLLQEDSQEVEPNSGAKVVRSIDLGSLASKLSRKRLKFTGGVETAPPQNRSPSPETGSGSGELSSSQKENYCNKVTDPGFGSSSDDTDLDGNAAPRKYFSPDRPETQSRGVSEEKECGPASKLPSPVIPVSLQSAVSSRLSKRKKQGSSRPDMDTPVLTASNKTKRMRHESDSNTALDNVSLPSECPQLPQDSVISSGAKPPKETPMVSLKTDPCDGSWQSRASEAQAGPCSSSQTSAGTVSCTELTEAGADTGAERERSLEPPRLPYYLRNFLTVLEAVLENQDDRLLFNEEDLAAIHTFQQLSAAGQMLYVRLFQRKLHWLRVSKLEYAEIGSDLTPVVQELSSCGLLQRESELQDLGEVLDLLPAPELRGLAKTFHVGTPAAQKQQLVSGLLRLGRQRSIFTLIPGQTGVGAAILKRAKQLAGACVRVCRGPRAVFSRVLLLFSLTDALEEEEAGAGGQNQLYTILLVNSGRLAFPAYTVLRRAMVFQDRDDLIRYEAAMHALHEVTMSMQAGNWEEALELYTTAKAVWMEQKHTYSLRHQEELPVFLRCFTAGWAYGRILSRGVEILQRLRRYEEAVEELQSLLAQSVFCPDSRGRWWDRLALNLHQHLKRTEQAIVAIREGLSDPLVRTGHRLSLYQRALRMKESPSCKKYRLLLRGLPTVEVQDVTHVTIRGQLFPNAGGMGKSVFMMAADEEGGVSGNDDAQATVLCSVEELALAHYRRLGFDQGIHGEGSTFSTLFGLLLWDIIFMDGIPDVFRNQYQTCPLDLHTDCFYENRQEAIETRVQLLCEASVETLHALLAETWSSQEGRVCALVNWERFSSLQQAQSLVSCLGGPFLGGMVRRMAEDYRHCRGGLPDLVVWSTSNNTYKLVEVKGPNDRLSQKQQIWLDVLRKLGADVEVCHVTDVGARGGLS